MSFVGQWAYLNVELTGDPKSLWLAVEDQQSLSHMGPGNADAYGNFRNPKSRVWPVPKPPNAVTDASISGMFLTWVLLVLVSDSLRMVSVSNSPASLFALEAI